MITETIQQVTLTFLHYPLTPAQDFVPIMQQPTLTDLDQAFASYPTPLIFYGHHHPFSDMQGRARYINPGSLGCTPTAEARYCRIDLVDGEWNIECCRVPYDDSALYHAFEARAVPERALIYRAFFAGRFSSA